MSRKPTGPPYSAEDWAYMESRPTRFSRQLRERELYGDDTVPAKPAPPENKPEGGTVEENPEVTEGPFAESAGPDLDATTREYVLSLTVAELRTEIRSHSVEPHSNKKADLQKQLIDIYVQGAD